MPTPVAFLPVQPVFALSGSLPSHLLSRAAIKPFNTSSRTSSPIMRLTTAEATKTVWLWTKSKEVMTASVERGWNTFIFTSDSDVQGLSEKWSSLARIRPLYLNNGQICDSKQQQVALFGEVNCAEDLHVLTVLPENTHIVVMDSREWQIINAENMIAIFQNSQASIFATARTAAEAKIFFESLEKGTDGIVLKTDDPSEVFALKAYLDSSFQEVIQLLPATIQRVELMGMGDRVCVDLCSLLVPGEGLLVGSFARGLFLVHSECLVSNYVASRPFRVNAGPVHAYVAVPGGRTAYLGELCSGMQALVVNAQGEQRPATIGRVKIETRPLILIEATMASDRSTIYSLLLQNAETVNLVRPTSTGSKSDNDIRLAVPVTDLKVGDQVLLSLQDSARHTGLKIEEFILEK